ncbi:serine-rich adhesin for platelets isoform X3 [Eurosta solidaginis]|uniref:serine-rich adhesin for platelets isoform X3 n=1 Tax=Eurosta solidaginis TaxID=178769 RepID=UPI00353075B2
MYKTDGFSPTITPTRDLSASASKSGISTTTTRINKLTASQQQQQQLEYESYQQKHTTVITAEQEEMNLIMKMPTATNTATASPTAPPTTMVSPIPRASKRNTPTSSNNSSPTKEKTERILYGGHYTPTTALPLGSRERRESGGDRKDWDTHQRQQQMLSPTTTTATPIPKQRSAYSPIKNSSSMSSAATKEIQQEVGGEKRGVSSDAITRLTGTTSVTASKVVKEERKQSSTAGGYSGVGGNNSTAVGASSGNVDIECDGEGERQANELGEESCGTCLPANKQIQSTTQAGSSPSRAHKSATPTSATTLPLSPTMVVIGTLQANNSQSTQQFLLKNERERTYLEQRGTSSTVTGYNNSNTTTSRVQTKNSNNPYSATSSSYSPSNYVIPPSSSGTTTGSGGGSGKIFSKLHNNQFIKNQQQLHLSGTQPSAAQQTNITARYLKYKSSHAQEVAGAAGGVGSETGSTSNYTALSGAYSPTKTFVAPTAIAIQKKKMVAAQEMKKTAQPSGNHTQRVGVAGSGSGGGGSTCARALALSGSGQRIRAPSQTEEVNFDPAEDLSYGPGIVSKLRCRYLSLAFRESMEKERHCLENMRRATSLNNLLDRDETADDDDETEDDLDGGSGGENIDLEVNDGEENGQEEGNVELRSDTEHGTPVERKLKPQGGILKHSTETAGAQDCFKKTTFQKHPKTFTTNGARHVSTPVSGGGTPPSAISSTPDTPRSRHIKRGNDSLKRARSVEALLCERSPWQYVALNRTSYQPQQRSGQHASNTPQPTCVTIEDKINNARSRLILGTDSMPPKRLTSVIDDTERPPPDLVKQTLKKFEATANRRGRGPNRMNGTGEVASKVATYKTIIKENKPAIVFPKPPLSPTKKLSTPLLTKPAAKPVVGASDLLSSPLGRKTTNAVSIASGKSTTATSNFATVAAVLETNSGAVGVGLAEHSPDIVPARHKLLMENVDSPVTALTKKLEKLGIEEVDKTQQQQQPTITKEVKQSPAQLNKQNSAQLAHDNEFVNNSELSNNKQASFGECGGGGASNKELVGGVDAGETADFGDAALEGNNENSANKAAKQHIDRAGTSASGGDESIVEHDSVQAGTVTTAISSDLSDDEDGLLASAPTTKRITRTALDNIARAGTTQQFKFASGGKSLLEQKSKSEIPTSVLNATPGKQIGVIRPLVTATAAQQATNSHTNVSNQQQLLQQHMEALKQHNAYHNNTTTTQVATHSSIYHSPQQLTSREIEKNRINEMKKTAGVLADGGVGGSSVAAVANASSSPGAANASLNTVINTNVKSSSSAHATSLTSGAAGLTPSTSGFTELDAAAQTNNSPLWALRIKRQTPPSVAQENTSMVFNFSNRKEVPDYIENDGVIFRRKRELPKPNESGFVLLGDLSLETSTDSDYDDFSMCPPSPCDVEFENANIVIDGKSSIRQKPKEATFRVQFNDTLTSTFEYPSEASLSIIEDPYSNESLISTYESDSTDSSPARHHHVAVDEIIQLPTPPSNTSTPANNVNNTNDASVIGSTQNTPTKNILGNLPLDYPTLDKGIMSQQQQPQQQPITEQLTKREEEQNAENAAALRLSTPAPLALEKTLTSQPQHETACNASPPAMPLSVRAENIDRRDAAIPNSAAMPHSLPQPPQPVALPQRPTDLPLPILSYTREMPAAQKMKKQEQQQRQQKPQVPQKRINRLGRQSAHLMPSAASKESPANALSPFEMPKTEMKQLQQQQKNEKELTEAIAKEEEPSVLAVEEARKMKINENLQCEQIEADAEGELNREKQLDVQAAQTLESAEKNEQPVATSEPAATICAQNTTQTPSTFDMGGESQLNVLLEYQLASANISENLNKNTGAMRQYTNNNKTYNTTTTTNTTTTVTYNKKPLSKYTMFHTLTSKATTTISCDAQIASDASPRARKTPAVLNKPQYARFLQIDLAATAAGGASSGGAFISHPRSALLRTRSIEFLYRGESASIGARKKSFNSASQNILQHSASQQQQRSASFSFGNNSVGRANGNLCQTQARVSALNTASINNNSNYADVQRHLVSIRPSKRPSIISFSWA